MYLCAFHVGGERLDRGPLFTYLARLRDERDADVATISAGPFVAAVPARSRRRQPRIVRWNHLVAVGDARLDNRAEVARIGNVPGATMACRFTDLAQSDFELSDLDLVVRAVDACGERCIPSILGDFAFVLWDPRAQKLIAARDAFGVKPLYRRKLDDVLLFSDRMDAIATDCSYDLDFIGDFLTGLVEPGVRTVWSGVRAVPAGGFLLQRGTIAATRRYWSPEDFTPEPGEVEPLQERFMSLLREGVRSRLGPAGTTWAQLSGGLDSSSVVALANDIAAPGQGLVGTITLVDTLGGGDERRYSDSVVHECGLRNEQVHDYWAWQEDDQPPPITDGPRPLYPFYARDRRTVDILRNAGARVVLSGFGSDHYLTGNPGYITDLAARGRFATALRELTRWSVSNRQSFWTLSNRHLVEPLLGLGSANGRGAQLPGWLDERFAEHHSLGSRTIGAIGRVKPGRVFAQRACRDVRSIPAWIDRWPFVDDVEVRYPFLYRPLVELSLRLPAELKTRPGTSKWILRESMRGMLPEHVRKRSSKGMIDARILWSLQRERKRIDAMLRDPILGQLGCIRPDALRREVDTARHGVPTNLLMLMSALSLETWLLARANRLAGPAARETAA